MFQHLIVLLRKFGLALTAGVVVFAILRSVLPAWWFWGLWALYMVLMITLFFLINWDIRRMEKESLELTREIERQHALFEHYVTELRTTRDYLRKPQQSPTVN